MSSLWQANTHHFILWTGVKMEPQLSQEQHIHIPSGRKPLLVLLQDRTQRSQYLQKYPCTLMHAYVLRTGITQIHWGEPQQNLKPGSLIHLEMENHPHIHLFLNQPSPTICCSLTFCGLLLPSSLLPEIRTPSTHQLSSSQPFSLISPKKKGPGKVWCHHRAQSRAWSCRPSHNHLLSYVKCSMGTAHALILLSWLCKAWIPHTCHGVRAAS